MSAAVRRDSARAECASARPAKPSATGLVSISSPMPPTAASAVPLVSPGRSARQACAPLRAAPREPLNAAPTAWTRWSTVRIAGAATWLAPKDWCASQERAPAQPGRHSATAPVSTRPQAPLTVAPAIRRVPPVPPAASACASVRLEPATAPVSASAYQTTTLTAGLATPPVLRRRPASGRPAPVPTGERSATRSVSTRRPATSIAANVARRASVASTVRMEPVSASLPWWPAVNSVWTHRPARNTVGDASHPVRPIEPASMACATALWETVRTTAAEKRTV